MTPTAKKLCFLTGGADQISDTLMTEGFLVAMNLAIVGATGLVGREMAKILTQRGVKADMVFLYASSRSEGKDLSVCGKRRRVHALNEVTIKNKDISVALFSAGAAVSKTFAPLFLGGGAVVIDNSSAFRMRQDVPLIVPEVNLSAIGDAKLIANPNCSTIQAVTVLKPLEDYKRIKRVIYCTYQAVSGAGQKGVIELSKSAKNDKNIIFPRRIYSNCIPQVDDFGANGYNFEEDKMINETKKIMSRPDLAVTATCVRVPVKNCHSESVIVEFYDDYALETVKAVLKRAKGVRVFDDYPTTVDADGMDDVLVGRIRRDHSTENGLHFWCVADNLRKGAALNAVQIAEAVIASRPTSGRTVT